MTGLGDLERRITKLETSVSRMDRAMAQLLGLVQEVGGLTISLISALISRSRIRLSEKTKAELRELASDLASRLGGDTDES